MQAMTPRAPRQVALTTVAEPVAAPDQALVTVEAYSVNRGETFLLDSPTEGWRPGKDVAGRVIAAAADGSGPAEGTCVVGHVPHSGWAERVAVATSSLAEVPADIPMTTAAALPLAGLTALRLLRRAGSVLGRRLLITGASGGVGHYVVELATAAGAHVTAVSATAERGTRLREFGATTVTDVENAEGWFDVTMESVGGSSFVEARRRTDPRGTVIWFGQAGRHPHPRRRPARGLLRPAAPARCAQPHRRRRRHPRRCAAPGQERGHRHLLLQPHMRQQQPGRHQTRTARLHQHPQVRQRHPGLDRSRAPHPQRRTHGPLTSGLCAPRWPQAFAIDDPYSAQWLGLGYPTASSRPQIRWSASKPSTVTARPRVLGRRVTHWRFRSSNASAAPRAPAR